MKKVWLGCAISLLVLAVAAAAFSQERRTLATPPPPPGPAKPAPSPETPDQLAATAQAHKLAVTTWWPDAVSGLMWTGTLAAKNVNLAEANAVCTQLVVDSRTGWRVPTLDEIDNVSLASWYIFTSEYEDPLSWVLDDIWSTTPASYGDYAIGAISERSSVYQQAPTKAGDIGAMCVRTMEPDVLAAIKALPSIKAPIPDLAVLETPAAVAAEKGRAAYTAGQYQEALDQAKLLEALEPNNELTYYFLGLCEGALGQWDQAVADLQMAQKMVSKESKVYNDLFKTQRKWAQAGQDAAKKGKTLDTKKYPQPTL